jgi:hypothetical protein
MLITGLGGRANDEIIKHMIEDEWAFKIKWPDVEVAVCFYKGDWHVAKYRNGVIDEFFIYSDAPGVNECESKILRGLLDALVLGTKGGENPCRAIPANVISKALNIWAANLRDIVEIEVLQTCRNACIDVKTGEIKLHY